MSEPKEPPSLEPEGPGAKKVARQFADCLAARERWAHEYGQEITLDHATARMVALIAERVLLVEQGLKEKHVPLFRELYELPDAVHVRRLWEGHAAQAGYPEVESEKLDASPMAKTMPAVDSVALFKRAFDALKDMRKLDDEDDSYQPEFTQPELLALALQLGQIK